MNKTDLLYTNILVFYPGMSRISKKQSKKVEHPDKKCHAFYKNDEALQVFLPQCLFCVPQKQKPLFLSFKTCHNDGKLWIKMKFL